MGTDAEIYQFNVALVGEEEVVAFDVPVHHFVLVQVYHRLAQKD